MIIEVRFTTTEDPDFQAVVQRLDRFFEERYGAEIASGFNGPQALEDIERTVVAYADGIPIGCGGWRWRGEGVAELRRIFVLPEYRRQGAATALLSALQKDAQRAGAQESAITTGIDMSEAIQFYLDCGFEMRPFFADMDPAAPCVCMRRVMQPAAESAL